MCSVSVLVHYNDKLCNQFLERFEMTIIVVKMVELVVIKLFCLHVILIEYLYNFFNKSITNLIFVFYIYNFGDNSLGLNLK